ncbi:isoprenylcysteine carboxylmethyltransferase family protein [Rhizobium ruizarguesonis]|uniref:isoprenylcysteine carboxylmethyltransferase family protein n=1 Tax=Rhizobium ruizarguesonis TaxID=2081791 RepID=UPI001031F0A3|nr:isoprenylcysteine carboxylmethyltransferase family protein [Rhizobium ruizarguesonis]TAW09935.1 DUF1295 domain-containing protein [Rhizobium ruizarguesonis]
MSLPLVAFIVLAFCWRIATVFISARHERALKAHGAIEYGALNSIMLAVSHVLYYLSAIFEASLRSGNLNSTLSIVGVAIYIAAALVLVSVIRSLDDLWTIKIILSGTHRLVKSGLFSFVRHPNYFLNIVPELVGFGLALNAFWTLIIGLPLYLIPLTIRIRQEEAAMTQRFSSYR